MASKALDVALNAKDNMSPAFQKAGNAAKTLGESLNNIGKNNAGFQSFTQQVQALDSEMRTVGQAMTGFGAGITAAVGLSVRSFASLESAMANVGTIAGQSDAWLAGMTEQIRSLAVELGTSPTGLAEGLYDLIGSGIDAADAMEVLKISATAAKAGLTDTGTAARAITSVLNAYSLSADKAGDVSDVLFNVVNEGVTTFEQLANNLSQTVPLAAAMGVGIEDLAAAYKELTLQGNSAATAETAIAGLLRQAVQPTQELTDATREYGYASVEALVQAEGLVGLLTVLEEASGGSSAAMGELITDQQALTAAMALTKGGVDEFATSVNDMFLSMQDGALTSAVAAQQMDTLAGSMSRLQAAGSVLMGVIGEAFSGISRVGIDAATDAITGLTGVIQSLPGPMQAAVAGMTGLAGGAALLAGGFLLLAPRIVETQAALQKLGGMRGIFGMMTGVVSPLGLALTGVAAAALLVYENMRRGSEAAKNYSASVETLTKTIEELKLAGEGGRATFLAGLQSQVDASVAMLDEAKDGALTFYDDLNLAAQGIDPTQYSVLLAGDFNRAIALADDANIQIGQALSNPNIDADAYSAEVQRLLSTITVTAEGSNIDEVMQQILDIDLTKFRQGVEDTRSDLEKLGDVTMDGLLSSIDRLGDGEAMLATINDRATELTTTLDDLRIDGDIELASQLGKINDLMQEGADSSDAYLDAQDRINGALADGTINYASVAAEITRLNEEYARTGDVAAYEAGMISLSQNLASYTAGSREALATTAELTAEFTSAALAIGGWDNALSQLNMTGLTGEVGLFAEGWSRANQAMDNTFRIIVGNTNAIIQQVDGIQSWADSLINVRGELGEIDNLLEGGFIDETIYANAQTAYDGIATSVGNIRNNLLAVQAIQAPFIAEVVAGTKKWAAELRQMPEDVQRTTLAFMDLQTVQQAQELITLGNSEAFKAMGDSGVAAFEATIQGALQVNPLLFNVLETMGIISGTPLDFEVNYDALEGAGSAIEQLTTQVGYLVDTLRQIYGLPPLNIEGSVDIQGADEAAAVVDYVYQRVTEADGTEAYLIVRVREDGEENVDRIKSSVENENGTYTVQVEAENGATYEAVLAQDGTVISTTYVEVVPQIAGGYSAAVGGAVPGSSMGADAFKTFLGVPDTVETTVTTNLVTTGLDDVTAAQTAIDGLTDKSITVSVDMDATSIGDVMTLLDTINTAGAATMTVDVVIGTNELDTGLTGWGLGTGGGGGAAGFDRKVVTVNVEADVTAAETAISGIADAEHGSVIIPVDADLNSFHTGLESLLPGGGDGVTINHVIVPVDADTSAAVTAINDLTGAASGVPPTVTISAIALTDGAVFALDNVTAAAQTADSQSVSVPASAPGADEAIGVLDGVTNAAEAADAMSVTIPVSVIGAADAIAILGGVSNAAASASRTVTITTNVVTAYSTVGSPGGGIYMQHGGIPSYATGGVLFRAAEGNRPEIAHFAGGGTALLPRDGLYTAPLMTYISPHNSSASYGGDTYRFFEGATFIGTDRDEMNRWAAEEFLPMFERAKQQRDIAKGLTV